VLGGSCWRALPPFAPDLQPDAGVDYFNAFLPPLESFEAAPLHRLASAAQGRCRCAPSAWPTPGVVLLPVGVNHALMTIGRTWQRRGGPALPVC